MIYSEFLNQKRILAKPCGIKAESPGFLYDFQKHAVEWALNHGRAAMFEDCGLGKTPQQLAWANTIFEHTGKPVLILAPLAVSKQTQREGVKFGIGVTTCREQADVRPGVNIANYEMLHKFNPEFGGLVLDESSILKSYSGTYRTAITAFAREIPYRLACTATPAPNDLIEIINHSEFLSVLTGKEAIALFFTQDGNTTHNWKLKGHAHSDFWKWLASWAIAIRRPSDIGFSDDAFVLPKLNIIEHVVDGHVDDGWLFPIEAQTLHERRHARRESITARVSMCADLANSTREPWVIWCDLNSESEALHRAIPDSIEVKGSDSIEHKIDAMIGFQEGKYRVLVTKPSICGFGMNWQHCARVGFVGLSDSWEQFYQAVRRCWRYGQTRDVQCHVIIAETEGAVLENIRRKERQANLMMSQMTAHMNQSYVYRKDDSRYEGKNTMEIPSFMRATK